MGGWLVAPAPPMDGFGLVRNPTPIRNAGVAFRDSINLPTGGWYPQAVVGRKENSVGGQNCVGWAGNSLVGDRFCWLGTQPTKSFGPGKNVEIFIFRCRSNEPIFVENTVILAPSALYRGRVHRKDFLRPFSGLRRRSTKSQLGLPLFLIRVTTPINEPQVFMLRVQVTS